MAARGSRRRSRRQQAFRTGRAVLVAVGVVAVMWLPTTRRTGSATTLETSTVAQGVTTDVVTADVSAQRLVLLGDSVPAGSACSCGGFGTDLASMLPAELTNLAVPGLTSNGLDAQLQTPTTADALRSATLVTVTIGANDFSEADASRPECADLGCYAPEMDDVVANVDSILTQIKSLTPHGTRIAVTGYWNVFLDGEVGSARGATYVAVSDGLSRELNARLGDLSVIDDVDFVDTYAPFKGSGDIDDTQLLAADGDHPNADGHLVIARAILAGLGLDRVR